MKFLTNFPAAGGGGAGVYFPPKQKKNNALTTVGFLIPELYLLVWSLSTNDCTKKKYKQ
jgi:hypothetical protein